MFDDKDGKDKLVYKIKKLEDIKKNLFDDCSEMFRKRAWYEFDFIVIPVRYITGVCYRPHYSMKKGCLKKFDAATCDWWIRNAMVDFCRHFDITQGYECYLLAKPGPDTTTVATTTEPTTTPSTTIPTTTEDILSNMIMYSTIGGSIFLLLACVILYVFHQKSQTERRAREAREAAMWGNYWMGSAEEGSAKEGSTTGGSGWTSSATSGTTGGTKTKKKSKKTGATSKTESTGTWL